MRRREFLRLGGAGCLIISPLRARAQRAAPAKIGFLGGTSSTVGQTLMLSFRDAQSRLDRRTRLQARAAGPRELSIDIRNTQTNSSV